MASGEYLESDAVFAVRRSLIQGFKQADDPQRAAVLGIGNPFRPAEFDLVVQRAPQRGPDAAPA